MGVSQRSRDGVGPVDASSRPVALGFRPDLEGVRAVAVALVLLNHFTFWPAGGFVGVDVFFVLSGFLITGLLLKEYDSTAKISFKNFYVRRVKRILPASTLVIAVTSVAVYAVFLGARVQQALVDGGWALAFAANWRFVLVGQDYFAMDRAASPFQHYWSLAVEEQFYLVWPLLILFSALIASRVGRGHGRLVLGVVLSGVTIGSFGWACVETALEPSTAYFSTFSRAWEMGAGGLLALLASSRKVRVPVPRLMSLVGLALILSSSVLLDPAWAFPGPWAVLPVAGTLIIIYSGIGVASARLNPLLTNRSSRYMGRISFSLYLWHWPVVVLLAAFVETGSLRFYAGAVIFTFVLSVVSFHCVEDPIRKSAWLTKTQRRPHGDIWRERQLRRWQTAGIVGFLLLTGIAVRIALDTSAPTLMAAGTQDEDNAARSVVASVAAEPGRNEVATQIQIALETREWPEFSVDLADLEDAKAPEWSTDQCTDLGDNDLERCTYDGPADKLAVVVGDSIAISWMPGIRAALASEGYETLSLTMGQCPAARAEVMSHNGELGFAALCLKYQDWTVEKIAELDPDLVIASSAENSLPRLVSGSSGALAEEEWFMATAQLLEAVTAEGRNVVILAPPPEGRSLQDCVTRFNSPDDCISTVGELWHTQSRAEADAVAQAASTATQYVDPREWFCNADDLCPAFVDGMPVRADGNHLTGIYSRYLGPHLRDALLGAAPQVATD